MAALFGGGDAGKSEMRKATRLMEQNIARLEAIGIPTIEAQRIALQSPELVGLLEAESLGPSRFEEISMDPRLQAAQMAALEDITGLAQSKEMDAMSRLNLEQGLAKSIGAQQASFQKIDENLELGAGQKLALKLQEIQNTGQRDMNIAMQAAANAQQAKIAALGQQANLASEIQQQQLGLAEKKANAADVINQFNTQNKQNVNARNLSERQRIAEAGIATKGQQEMYNKALIQQQFQNQMAKATGVTGQQTNLANLYGQQAAAAQQAQQAMTSGLFQLAGTAAGAMVGGPAGAAVGGQVGAAAAPKPSTNYAVNWQPGKDPYGNIG